MIDKEYKKQLEAFGVDYTEVREGDIKRIESAAEIEAKNSIVKAIMDTVEGRQYLYNKLDMCGVFTSPVVKGDPYGTHVLCGVQSVGHVILNDIMLASPKNFPLMLEEAAARKQNYS